MTHIIQGDMIVSRTKKSARPMTLAMRMDSFFILALQRLDCDWLKARFNKGYLNGVRYLQSVSVMSIL
jgi:hypothetical protein